MSTISATLDTIRQAERRTALRQLLRHPLTLAHAAPDAFTLILRHREWLAGWFAEHPSWKLVVSPAAGFARLHKVPAAPDASRGARLAARPPFDRRRYVLLCLTLAALDETAGQTTVRRLAEILGSLSRGEDGMEPFDPNLFSERRALVDVLRFLVERGALGVRDGDTERWAQDESGDALLDVNERLLGQLVGAPVPPALAKDPGELAREPYPDTEEGERLKARHQVLRRLLDDPVVYYDELSPREYEWLDHSRGFVYRLLAADIGLHVERRREGLAAVDPEAETSDTLFPDGGSTVKHAALLLAECITAHARRERNGAPGGRSATTAIAEPQVLAWTAALMSDYGELCHWSRQYPPDDDGVRRLADDAMALLESFRLVTRIEGGRLARPAIARFAPEAARAGVP